MGRVLGSRGSENEGLSFSRKTKVFICSLLYCLQAMASPRFLMQEPDPVHHYALDGAALCATAKETLAYLNQGSAYDPRVIHQGKVLKIPLARVKATLAFICQHQHQLNDPSFIKAHFDFIRWYPDRLQASSLKINTPLVRNIPQDKILMTKYYVHLAKVSAKSSSSYPLALYALPKDEASLTLDEAESKPGLIRFRYGKQAILKGALDDKPVPVLAYLNRNDLETALMQGTVRAEFMSPGHQVKTFNVHRSNNIPYNRAQNPYQQERYWYFKEVDGIKGYGKDAEHKITVQSQVTFAADIEQFGLGKVLMVQYPDRQGKLVAHAGILADTGGAFQNNLYQVDFLTGSYAGNDAFYKANASLPNYVKAYFMVLKK